MQYETLNSGKLPETGHRKDPDHVISKIPRVNSEIVVLKEIEAVVAQFEECYRQMNRFNAAGRDEIRQGLLAWLPKAMGNIDGKYTPEFGRHKRRLEYIYLAIGGRREN